MRLCPSVLPDNFSKARKVVNNLLGKEHETAKTFKGICSKELGSEGITIVERGVAPVALGLGPTCRATPLTICFKHQAVRGQSAEHEAPVVTAHWLGSASRHRHVGRYRPSQ